MNILERISFHIGIPNNVRVAVFVSYFFSKDTSLDIIKDTLIRKMLKPGYELRPILNN